MSASAPRYFLVLPAAGAGRRMQSAVPKQYQLLLDKPLLQHTLERVASNPAFSKIVVSLAADDERWPQVEATLPSRVRDRLMTVQGGAERAASVQAALIGLRGEANANDWVLVHDAVRPCLDPGDLAQLLQALSDEPYGGLLATPVRETVKAASAHGTVIATMPRENLWLAATPQMFRFGVLSAALETASTQGADVTDEASAVELWLQTQPASGAGIKLIPGKATNLKVTYPEDLHLAALLLGDGNAN